MTGQIVAVGEALVDLVPVPGGGTPRAHPGGSPANVALGLARLGHRVTLLTSLGEDPFGALVADHLGASGVRVTNCATEAERRRPTSVAAVTLDPDGLPRYDLSIGWDIEPLEPPAGTVAVHTGSLATALRPGRDQVEAFLAAVRGRATVSYDPNIRPALLADPRTERDRVERQLTLCDVVKASVEDLAWLYPGVDPITVATGWLRHGPVLVAVTDGERGAVAVTNEDVVRAAALPVTVADTVGAGDAFTAGLLSALGAADMLGEDRWADLVAIGAPELADVLRTAVVAAGLTCTRSGAQPPTRAELDAALARD